jgi:hypothetical protein
MRHNYTYQAFGTLEKATDTIESQHLFRGENFDKGIGSSGSSLICVFQDIRRLVH